jgi:hypothetical protein
MKARIVAGVLLVCAFAGCGKSKPATATGATNAAASGGNPITAPVDYLGAVVQAQKHSVKVVDTVQVQQAIQQFHAAEDRYPKGLDELVKEGYLARLPQLPAGMQYDYSAANGQVKAVPAKQPLAGVVRVSSHNIPPHELHDVPTFATFVLLAPAGSKPWPIAKAPFSGPGQRVTTRVGFTTITSAGCRNDGRASPC